MTIKPILFSGPMVQAILEGRKTMTRRVVRFARGLYSDWSDYVPDGGVLYGSNNIPAAKAPYKPGNILWVRETWLHLDSCKYCMCDNEPGDRGGCYLYRATHGDAEGLQWKSARYMPKAAARIFLRVTDVRAGRVQDITHEDAILEGFEECYGYNLAIGETCECVILKFAELWDKINAKRGYGWDKNPWVWAYSFERCEKPEGWCDE